MTGERDAAGVGFATVGETRAGAGGLSVRGYRPPDRAAILDLIERVWDGRRRRDHEFLWDWKHALDRSARHPGHVAQVLERDGRPIGYSGALPARFTLDGDVVEGAFCIDLLVDARERGAGTRLMRHLLERGTMFLGSTNDRTEALWRRLIGRRGIVVRQARKMILVLDPGPALAARGAPTALIAAARAANSLLRRAVTLAGSGGGRGLALEEVGRFPAAVDDLCADFARGFRFQVVRDHHYLDWRFAACPFDYRIVLLRERGTPRGYAVYRPAVLNGRRVLLLVEMLASGAKGPHYALMLRNVLAAARACGAAEIHTLDAGCPALRRALWRAGFLHRRERLPIIGYLGPGRATPDGFYGSDGWYLGLGDGDFEFIFYRQGVDSRVADTEAGERPRDEE